MTDILIVDSGGTKIRWAGAIDAITQGYNAVADSGEALNGILADLTDVCPDIKEVKFFGAGITDNNRREIVAGQLRNFFPNAVLYIDSDLAEAAMALCGDKPGVAAILGTGANSCIWDGEKIVVNTPSLGYVIGDEGSGTVMGRNFIERLLKHGFSKKIEAEVPVTVSEVIEKVYRGDNPRGFLSSFAPVILSLSMKYDEVSQFVIEQFRNFFTYNIDPYGLPRGTEVNFTGSIAYHFTALLNTASELSGYRIGRVVTSPIDELIKDFI